MSIVKTPPEIDAATPVNAPELPGLKKNERTVGVTVRGLGQRLARSRLLVKLGEMADKSSFDEVNGTKPRMCSVCRPH